MRDKALAALEQLKGEAVPLAQQQEGEDLNASSSQIVSAES